MSATAYATVVILAHVAWTVIWHTRIEERRARFSYRLSLAMAAGWVVFAMVVAAGLEFGAGESDQAGQWLIATVVIGFALLAWIEVFWRWLRG